MQEEKLIFQTERGERRIAFELVGILTGETASELQLQLVDALNDITIETILVDLCDLDLLEMSGFIALIGVNPNFHCRSKIHFTVASESQPHHLLLVFATDDMPNILVTPRSSVSQAQNATYRYVESTDPAFNAAQRELLAATDDYHAARNLYRTDRFYNVYIICERISQAARRQAHAIRDLEATREALAKNLIAEISHLHGL